MESNFSKTQNVLEMSLNANLKRWNVLSNNIANANTPNFKRSDVTFSAQMQRALSSQQNPYPFEAKKGHEKHIPFFERADYKQVSPKLQTEYYSTIMNNGNNVDPEFEMAEASKTILMYEATSSMINRNYNSINMLLK
ncbi:MAG: flagellar basal body rod protein FlgB [Spirochaetae bacterium HGW-Spirochaetae-6]|nr:MAG: flagellar basal body rod protein FlgB [Spirochaetae bacterium HGW-Spirochaetae-6]